MPKAPYVSYRTLAFLRDAHRGKVSDSRKFLETLDQRTLASVLRQGFVTPSMEPTEHGLEWYERYTTEHVPTRKKVAELSSVVDTLLSIRRKRAKHDSTNNNRP